MQNIRPTCVTKAYLVEIHGWGQLLRLVCNQRRHRRHLPWYLQLALIPLDARAHLLRHPNQLYIHGLNSWEGLDEAKAQLTPRQRGVTADREGAVYLGVRFILLNDIGSCWREATAKRWLKHHHAADLMPQQVQGRCLPLLVRSTLRLMLEAYDAFGGSDQLDRGRPLLNGNV
jgi:hypothetical protein